MRLLSQFRPHQNENCLSTMWIYYSSPFSVSDPEAKFVSHRADQTASDRFEIRCGSDEVIVVRSATRTKVVVFHGVDTTSYHEGAADVAETCSAQTTCRINNPVLPLPGGLGQKVVHVINASFLCVKRKLAAQGYCILFCFSFAVSVSRATVMTQASVVRPAVVRQLT